MVVEGKEEHGLVKTLDDDFFFFFYDDVIIVRIVWHGPLTRDHRKVMCMFVMCSSRTCAFQCFHQFHLLNSD